ncbi:helix-turn-helix domain-containing protein [Methylobacterium sp. ARG-1]|uniref:helix-turn-helix domain-containing protein n=1 Tax=Methylobacterium sp. ARG-1 TaxID=1692501 RepID=UPI001FCD63BE|nr:helix-turn-helix domain-containing protein [Methylobacterium sp. ARG-1]
MPYEPSHRDDGPFTGKRAAARPGPLSLMRIIGSATRSEAPHEQIQRHSEDGTVVVIFKLAGVSMLGQEDRSTVQRPGDIVVIDHRPAPHESHAGSQALLLELPRERLESVLGFTRLYAAMATGADGASTAVTVTFVHELVRLCAQLDPASAARMASIGIDWIRHRRPEVVTKRLTEPRGVHLSIGPLSFGFGFANQTRFSRRFKERHGMTPREYRQVALVSTP